MMKNSVFTRRSLFAPLAATFASASTSNGTQLDPELATLTRQLDFVGAALERAGGHDEVMALLDKMESLGSAIASTPATTLEGLRVKARATAWALLGDFEGDFDPSEESSINSRVAASIVRDLLRMTPYV